MRFFSSLQSRIFLTSAVLAVLSIGIALYVVNRRITSEGEAALHRDLRSTADLVDQLRQTRTESFTTMARFIADVPHLKAAVTTDDPKTVQEEAKDYPEQLKSKLLLITSKTGGVLATFGATPRTAAIVAGQPAIREALTGRETLSLLPQPDGVLQLITVPMGYFRPANEIIGTLSVGFLLDDALAGQLKAITRSDIAFGMDGQILATTLPRETRPQLSELLRASDMSRTITVAGEDYVALPRPLASNSGGLPAGAGPVVLILRSRTEQLRPLEAIQRALAAMAIVAVLLATVLGFAVARTITRPLAAITDVMREVAATGDLTRKIVLGSGRRWEDEDARLLATTFNTLTDSIARFQREITHKERLSALGRLSTVIAHEVRNPLMIIKASLHVLRRPDASRATIAEAAADIDEEVSRLNRVVNEVLDFARPIRFESAPTDLNALCRESAAATEAGAAGPAIHLALASGLPPVVLDPERMRIALVNLLANARHAVEARQRAVEAEASEATAVAAAAGRASESGRPAASVTEEPPGVTLRTAIAADRAIVVVADRGIGIKPADLPRVFDPYFTTKRGGTGLGLAIAKNIVEGLGGTIGVMSTPGAGTEIRLELPVREIQPAAQTPS